MIFYYSIFAGLLTAFSLRHASADPQKCDDCAGPWVFPFNAEKTLHAVIANNTLAKAYNKKVLRDNSLTIASRALETYTFLNGHSIHQPVLRQLYASASEMVISERRKNVAALCHELGDTVCMESYLQLEIVLDDDSLSEAEQCSKVGRLLCNMTAERRARLYALPPYRYQIERGRSLPTFAQAFKDTYALSALNTSTMQTALVLLESFKTKLEMKFSAFEKNFTQWIDTLEDEDANAAASFQWYLYQFEHFPKYADKKSMKYLPEKCNEYGVDLCEKFAYSFLENTNVSIVNAGECKLTGKLFCQMLPARQLKMLDNTILGVHYHSARYAYDEIKTLHDDTLLDLEDKKNRFIDYLGTLSTGYEQSLAMIQWKNYEEWYAENVIVNPMCWSCEGPWIMPFNAEKALNNFFVGFLKDEYNKRVLNNGSLTFPERKTATQQFMRDHLLIGSLAMAQKETFIEQLHFKSIYKNLTLIESFERASYYAELDKRFTVKKYRKQWIQILDAALSNSLSYDQMCEKIKATLCGIPLEVLMNLFPKPLYRYSLESGQPFPEFPKILTTYTFRNLSKQTQEKAENFLDNHRVNPERKTYIKWANQLPTEESRTLAAFQWTIYQNQCNRRKEHFQFSIPKIDVRIRCSSCVGPWNFLFNVDSVMLVMLNNYNLEMEYHCIMREMDITKKNRAKGIRQFLISTFGSGSTVMGLYSNATMIAAYEKNYYFQSLYNAMDDQGDELLRSILEIYDNETLSDSQSCALIEQLLCGRDIHSVILQAPSSSYRISPHLPLPDMTDMLQTYIFGDVPTNIKTSLRHFASKHEVTLAQMRSEYEQWAKQLFSKESKALAMLQWRVYELRLKRLDHENMKKLKQIGVAKDVQNRYQEIVHHCYANEDPMILTEAEAAMRHLNLKEIHFPVYFDQ